MGLQEAKRGEVLKKLDNADAVWRERLRKREEHLERVVEAQQRLGAQLAAARWLVRWRPRRGSRWDERDGTSDLLLGAAAAMVGEVG